jgi:hypothetical protein
MTFKEYLTTPEGRRAAIKLYRKLKAKREKKDSVHPVSKETKHMDSSNMGATAQLPAATQGNQPGLS